MRGGGQETCWTRALELRLLALVREREVLWRPRDNTNHNIQLKYRAYAELARLLAPHATARWVRDRWVNIRSTFNHNLRKVTRSEQRAAEPSDVYVPTWPLWSACQFLRRTTNTSEPSQANTAQATEVAMAEEAVYSADVDEDAPTTVPRRPSDPAPAARRPRPGRPRIPPEFRHQRPSPAHKGRGADARVSGARCGRALRSLVRALRPLAPPAATPGRAPSRDYWCLGRHVAESLASMRPHDARAAARRLRALLTAPTLSIDAT